jgi:hypothetical protein
MNVTTPPAARTLDPTTFVVEVATADVASYATTVTVGSPVPTPGTVAGGAFAYVTAGSGTTALATTAGFSAPATCVAISASGRLARTVMTRDSPGGTANVRLSTLASAIFGSTVSFRSTIAALGSRGSNVAAVTSWLWAFVLSSQPEAAGVAYVFVTITWSGGSLDRSEATSFTWYDVAVLPVFVTV